MKLERTCVKLIHGKDNQSPQVSSLPSSQLLSFIWELTIEVYSLSGILDAESRLQRDIAHLSRRES